VKSAKLGKVLTRLFVLVLILRRISGGIRLAVLGPSEGAGNLKERCDT